MISYYDIYEEEYQFIEDIQFIETLLKGGSVLEVGCGTGRVLKYLSSKNKYDLFGLDINDEAIRIAKKKLKNDKVKVIVDDATSFSHLIKYDTILFLFNGLMHITNSKKQLSFLKNAYRHLKDEGELIFYVSNPDPSRMLENFSYYKHQKTLTVNSLEVEKFECNKYDLNGQLIHRIFNYDYVDANGCLKRVVSKFTVRYFFKKELELILSGIGFRSISFFGNFDGSGWSKNSPHIIIKAIK